MRQKGVWLSKFGMQPFIPDGKLHAHTIDACVDAFYASLKSWRTRRKTVPNAHPRLNGLALKFQ